MKKVRLWLTVCLAALAVMAMTAVAFAADGINWETSKLEATGLGIAPTNAVNSVQAKMLARRAAVVDAYRQLAEIAGGVNVNSESTVQNMMVLNDVTTTKVNAVIRGARVVNEYQTEGGGYAVTLEVDMYGVSNSLASAVLTPTTVREAFPPLAANVAPTPAPVLTYNAGPMAPAMPTAQTPVVSAPVQVPVVQAPQVTAPAAPAQAPVVSAPQVTAPVAPQAPVVQAPQAPSVPEKVTTPQAPEEANAPEAPVAQQAAVPQGTAVGSYTGLIVDCSGMGLRPAMSPVIKNDLGTAIYGYQNLDSSKVISKGMAGYTTDITQASRAGSNPLVVRAVSLDGSNPVISAADANRVLLENSATGFLDATNVVFVR